MKTVITRGEGIGKYESLIEVFDDLGNRKWAGLCSTIPDYPQGGGESNGGMPEATVMNGVYKLLTKYQDIGGENWRVLELVTLGGNQKINVLCRDGYRTSEGINIHYCGPNDSDEYPWSTGCIVMRRQTFNEFRRALGIPRIGFKAGIDCGQLIIRGSVLGGLYEPYTL